MSLSEIKLQSIPETEKGIQTGFALVIAQNDASKPATRLPDPKETILASTPKLREQLFNLQTKLKQER